MKTERPRPHVSLATSEPVAFGHGWVSGVLSVVLGTIGLGAVLCLHYPQWLTMPALRELYPLPAIRAALHATLVGAFLLGTVSLWLRQNKALGLTGVGMTLAAAMLGGSQVPVKGSSADGPYLGLDWFLLNLILYSLVFIPLERLFALRVDQGLFRLRWRTDLVYFFVSTLLVQVMSYLTLRPAAVLFDWARRKEMAVWVSELPVIVQVVAILLVADLTQYWVHRAFHVVPALWRFHAIHHSAETMDWLAGSRLHLLDAIVTRGLAYIPLYVLGFSRTAVMVYVVIVAAQATFIHANVRWRFHPVRRVLATPAFHHWHHSAEPEAVDKNFAVHTPLWDLLFGTYFLPERWPKQYGLSGGGTVPDGWTRQLLNPFR